MDNHKEPQTDSFLILDTHLRARKVYGFVVIIIVLNILVAAMMINLISDDCQPGLVIPTAIMGQ